MLTAAVITVSDSCYAGKRIDESGDVVKMLLEDNGFCVMEKFIVPDDAPIIAGELRRLSRDKVHLIVTSGGTGFSLRDVTPEATLSVIDRQAFGIAEAMRAHSYKHTDRAMLSRGVCGISGYSVIINLPGSPISCRENLEFVIKPLIHGIETLCGIKGECARKC